MVDVAGCSLNRCSIAAYPYHWNAFSDIDNFIRRTKNYPRFHAKEKRYCNVSSARREG